jgi:hypothetical protein
VLDFKLENRHGALGFSRVAARVGSGSFLGGWGLLGWASNCANSFGIFEQAFGFPKMGEVFGRQCANLHDRAVI